MGTRALSKKELDDQRKKEEEEAAAHVFQEFVETFQEAPSKTSKVWVKAGTYDAGARKEDTSERGKIYKPQSKLSDAIERQTSAERAQEYARLLSSKSDKPSKRRDKDKKKSNLELFKEELRQIQEEREERHKYKGVLRGAISESTEFPKFLNDENLVGSYDNGDPTTTNLYLGNLNPKITEQQLMEIFGRYGPLASIKIMWPRSDEEKARGRNCGFVAFMSRKDGERALRCLNGKEVLNYEMKMGWGKALCIPPHPIYIPPTMQQPSLPPPPSGLPFNAQPPRHMAHKIPRLRAGEACPTEPEDKALFDQILSQSIVKVVIPTERNILMLIHRMVEFVIREGPMFEAMIMNKEINNPMFRFLFENQSPVHVYYRWKLFSLLQGDVQKQWSIKEFRMFKGGSVWRPPVMNVYTQGMPDELVEEESISKGSLSKTQRERLEDLIRQLTPERQKIADAMVFCMEHADAAEEIADCISESLSMVATAIHKKIARMYLISDILHNCGIKLSNASYFRKAFQQRLEQIFRDARLSWENLDSRLQAEGFRARVGRVMAAWEDWAVYPKELLMRLHNLFNGIDAKETSPVREVPSQADWHPTDESGGSDDDADSASGGPLDGAALRRLAGAGVATAASVTPIRKSIIKNIDDDIDGVPLDEDIDGIPLADEELDGLLQVPGPGFIPSRWESVDPADVEAQAVTTSQWQRVVGVDDDVVSGSGTDGGGVAGDTPPAPSPPRYNTILQPSPPPPPSPSENNDSSDLSVERRALLRNVELKALSYQDELEAGRKPLKSGWTLQQQVQHYRKKLIKKAEREAAKEKEAETDSPDSRISERRSYRERDRDKERERERENRTARSGSSDDGFSRTSSKKSSKRIREISLSPPPKRSRHRSRSSSRGRNSRRRQATPPTPPALSPVRSHHREHSRHSRESRREPSPPIIPTSRKHRHKHKY